MPRLALLLVPIVAIAAALAMPSLDTMWPRLLDTLHAAQSLAASNPAAAAAGYVAAYAGMAALCLPVGPLMGVAGGILFGTWMGALLASAGATLGATTVFGLARRTLRRSAGPRQAALLARMQSRLHRNGFWVLLALRVPPVLPSWMLNLGAAFAGMNAPPFVAATALGLLPASAVFAGAGHGMADALAGDAVPPLGAIMRPQIVLPLLAAAGLMLLPLALRLRKQRAG